MSEEKLLNIPIFQKYLQLDSVSGYVGRYRREALVGAVYRGGAAATFIRTAGSSLADQKEDQKNTSQASSEAHHDCCHFLSLTGLHFKSSSNHSGELSVFDKSFLTSLSSLVNYLSTLEIFSLPGRVTTRRHHPSLSAAEF